MDKTKTNRGDELKQMHYKKMPSYMALHPGKIPRVKRKECGWRKCDRRERNGRESLNSEINKVTLAASIRKQIFLQGRKHQKWVTLQFSYWVKTVHKAGIYCMPGKQVSSSQKKNIVRLRSDETEWNTTANLDNVWPLSLSTHWCPPRAETPNWVCCLSL